MAALHLLFEGPHSDSKRESASTMPPKGKDASAMKQTTLKGFFAKPQNQPTSSPAPTPTKKVATPAVKTPKNDASGSSSLPSSASKTISSQSTKSSSSTKATDSPAVAASSPIDVDEEDDGVEVVLTSVRSMMPHRRHSTNMSTPANA